MTSTYTRILVYWCSCMHCVSNKPQLIPVSTKPPKKTKKKKSICICTEQVRPVWKHKPWGTGRRLRFTQTPNITQTSHSGWSQTWPLRRDSSTGRARKRKSNTPRNTLPIILLEEEGCRVPSEERLGGLAVQTFDYKTSSCCTLFQLGRSNGWWGNTWKVWEMWRIWKAHYNVCQHGQSETGCEYVFSLSHSHGLVVPLSVPDSSTTNGFGLKYTLKKKRLLSVNGNGVTGWRFNSMIS